MAHIWEHNFDQNMNVTQLEDEEHREQQTRYQQLWDDEGARAEEIVGI